jgi:predicted GH43/DUF377 family glycosyl hydrolase
MQWLKHGVVYCPDGNSPWATRYATCPTPIWLDNGTLRVYIQCRDQNNIGRIGYVDLDPDDPRKVLHVAKNPVLDIGAPGTFDDNGVFQTSIVKLPDGHLYLYYVGFELCQHIRYRLLTGLAISEDGGETFHRIKPTPILERSATELYFRCGPYVLPTNDGRFLMWYVAGSEWQEIDGKQMPIYDLRYAESGDGIHWPKEGRVVLSLNQAEEHGFGRPYIVSTAQGYKLYYSIRKKSPCAYRMGYAESIDGLHWKRKDDSLGLDVSPSGWDSESVEYGAEIVSAGKTWLLYNGNDFGVTGFGIAERLEP